MYLCNICNKPTSEHEIAIYQLSKTFTFIVSGRAVPQEYIIICQKCMTKIVKGDKE